MRIRGIARRFAERFFPRWLAYRRLRARAPRQPATYSEKVVYKLAFDRRPVLHTFADKYATRGWVTERVGAEYLPKLLAVGSRPEDIDWASLPEEYVAKVSHGSGGTIIVSAAADAATRLPEREFEVGWIRYWIRPERADLHAIQGLLRHWLSLRFEWWPGRPPEWAYRGVPPRIMVEELIRDAEEALPADLRTYVYNGRLQFLRMSYTDPRGEHSSAHYDRDGTPIDVTFIEAGKVWPQRVPAPPAPPELEEIIELAERLSGGIDFVRVDLYRSDRGLLVGELTSYPTAGDFSYDPPEFTAWAGKDWHPETLY